MVIRDVFDGWVKGVFDSNMSPERTAMTNERLAICAECPFAVEDKAYSVVKKLIDGVWKEESRTEIKEQAMQMRCDLCRCQLYAKTTNPQSNCPGNLNPTLGVMFHPKWVNRADIK